MCEPHLPKKCRCGNALTLQPRSVLSAIVLLRQQTICAAINLPHWHVQTTDDSLAPLSINCWPSQSGAESYVNIEYEATTAFDLQTVVIAIPLPAMSHGPRVSQVHALTALLTKNALQLGNLRCRAASLLKP
jgi:hypothetical protein